MDKEKYILARLARVLYFNPKKLQIFRKLQDRCIALTSDDGISLELETYRDPCFHLGEYYRINIIGTRSNQTITFDNTDSVFRKPADARPFRVQTAYNRNCYEVLDIINSL